MDNINQAIDTFLNLIPRSIHLSKSEQRFLSDLPIYKLYPKGTHLFEVGDQTDLYYFVLQGGLRSYRIVEGNDVSLGFFIEHEAFIPSSTALNKPSEIYAVCFEDTYLVALSESMQMQVEQEIPQFRSLCRRFSEQELAKRQDINDRYKALSPEQTYQRLVKDRPELIQRVPQYHIATYLGIRPESLSRIRSRLSQPKKY